jgi:pilus assembly protein FimV
VNKRNLTLSVAVALAFSGSPAFALGLGQLQVKSGLNQPLVAEIPIIASAPGEIDNLEVKLASPEAFERVGLVRPSHSTANLSFSVGKNARGQPVVLVTSSGKFSEPFLSFLVEADWGKGTVTKEYTALIDPPYIAKAVIRPLEAPTVAVAPLQTPPPEPLPMESTIKLSPEPATVEAPVAAAVTPVQPVATDAPAPAAVAAADPAATAPDAIPASTPDAPAPMAAEALPPSPPAPAAVAEAAPIPVVPDPAPQTEYGPVASGETLSKIALKLNPDADSVSVKQMMMALLRANPDAFQNENVNQLKRGAVMRIPGRDEAMVLSDEQASTLIAEQSAAWNARRAPVLQPTETVTQTNPSPQPEVAEIPPAPVPAQANPQPVAEKPVTKPVSKPVASARLEIVPPSKKTATVKAAQSGAASGAGGTELRAELTQAREDVAIRDTQINELKSRVNDLESQETNRQKLIEMQNSQLKALQDELAKRDGAAPAAVAPIEAVEPKETLRPVTESEKPAAAVTTAPAWYMNPLLHYAVGGAIFLGGLIWMFRRRREPAADAGVIAGRRISDDNDFQASLAAMKPKLPEAVATTSVQAAVSDDDAMPETKVSLPEVNASNTTASEDTDVSNLHKQIRSKPQDLEAHLALLRHHYGRGDASAFETAAIAMRSQVSTVLDPRWREAVVMGVTLLPDNTLFQQSGWNTPRYADEKASASYAPAPSFVNVADAKPQDTSQMDSLAAAWNMKPESNTVTPIEEIGPFTDEPSQTLAANESAAAENFFNIDDDEGAEADLMVSDPSSSTKIELASAYLDIGDVEGARSMLEEVVDHGSAPAKRLAARLLKEIG